MTLEVPSSPVLHCVPKPVRLAKQARVHTHQLRQYPPPNPILLVLYVHHSVLKCSLNI